MKEVTSSPDHKMIKLLTFDNFFSTLKLVVEWRQLPRFPAQKTLVHARVTTSYWENLELVVVLVLELKKVFLEGVGRGEGNWAEITLVKTSGAVTKDGEKFDQKLTGAGRVQQATGGSISASIPSHF